MIFNAPLEQIIVLFIICFTVFVLVVVVLFEMYTHIKYTMKGKAVPGSFQELDEKFNRMKNSR